jgi:hypothetical protein
MAGLCTCCQRDVDEVRLREGRTAAAVVAAKLERECNRRCEHCGVRIRCDGEGHVCREVAQEAACQWSAYRDAAA